LAALEETMRRFPHDAVAPTARAEVLRDLGRHDEALAASEEATRRFPHNEVASAARAEVLRDLGRHDEALAALEETRRRFPHNAVAPAARAEVLRDLGRHDEALSALEETTRRFPYNRVAATARAVTLRDMGRYEEAIYALMQMRRSFPRDLFVRNTLGHVLAMSGKLSDAQALLSPVAENPKVRDDWIASHILATAWLKAGKYAEATSAFETGARDCSFRDVRPYFETASKLALLLNDRAVEAATQIEALAQRPQLPRKEVVVLRLFQAHALAEAGKKAQAEAVLGSATILDFAGFREKRLKQALTEQYGLTRPISAGPNKKLTEEIKDLEIGLITPPLWNTRAIALRAA
jgi:tetratricopeptide (TPR) repeat protein